LNTTAAAASTLEAVEAAGVPMIEFVVPLPGFPLNRRFVLVRLHDEGVLFALTSVDDENLRFLVVPPEPFFPDYAPEIDQESLAALGATEADTDGLIVLVMITAGDTVGASTANLMAPIVLHGPSRRAVQLVLAGTDLSIHTPLLIT
jgi:flagellar assembly factor FliW